MCTGKQRHESFSRCHLKMILIPVRSLVSCTGDLIFVCANFWTTSDDWSVCIKTWAEHVVKSDNGATTGWSFFSVTLHLRSFAFPVFFNREGVLPPVLRLHNSPDRRRPRRQFCQQEAKTEGTTEGIGTARNSGQRTGASRADEGVGGPSRNFCSATVS